MNKLSTIIGLVVGLTFAGSGATAQESQLTTLTPSIDILQLGKDYPQIDSFPVDDADPSIYDDYTIEYEPRPGGTQYQITLDEVTADGQEWTYGMFNEEIYPQENLRDRKGVFIRNNF